MSDIEIPLVGQRGLRYRLFEMLPAVLSWGTIAMAIVLSFISPVWAAYFIIGFILIWFMKAMAMAFRVFQGYARMRQSQGLNWPKLLKDVDNADASLARLAHDRHRLMQVHYYNVLSYRSSDQTKYQSTDIIHAVIIATYNESNDVVEPTVESVVNSTFDHASQTVLIMAYEERGGAEAKQVAHAIVKKYGKQFLHAEAIEHPQDMPNEMIGKGGNITYAGRQLADWLAEHEIDPERVIVTTLDSDNRPHPSYFGALTYAYLVSSDRIKKSFQPIPMYLNNIWDVPAPMRVIATGNSFWMVIQSVRPHLLRNFSSHAQPMAALLKTDFWSVRTIVEDGHQFWRSYFAFDGDYDVIPLYVPIYQDAVLAATYVRTLKAQFIQIRRWAWGASDIAYVLEKGLFTRNSVPKLDLLGKLLRLVEGHWSWATASLILAFAGWLPLLLIPNSDAFVVHQLPVVISRIQTIATLGILVTMFLSLKALPPKPARYRRGRHFWMVIQWVWLPIVNILYSSFAALNSQTRLFFGWYLGKFDITEKAVRGYAELPGQLKDREKN